MSASARTGRCTWRGVAEAGVLVFRGIRFAEPPVGERRFAPPEPADPPAGEHDATRFAPAPWQETDDLDSVLGTAPRAPLGEDCLALNVWTPGTRGRRPVLVWIHGGGFASGSTSIPLYDGARLAREADAVVVSLGYRVGALGFLHLGGERTNLGLQDQVAGLRFVREHATAFGGDPDRITVFGESAGAGSVCALLAMPGARGLFARAVVQSAAPDGVLDADEAAERAARVVAELGVGAEARGAPPDERLLAALRALPAERILAAQAAVQAAGPHRKGMLFMPVVDGHVLPERPLAAVGRGAARDVALVVGTTREEMHLFALRGMGEAVADALLLPMLTAQLGPEVEDAPEAAARVLSGYRRLRAERGEATSPAELFYALQTDLGLRYHSALLAEHQAAHQPDTWMYLFTWPSPLRGGALRSCHALDLPFTFGTLDAPGMKEFAGGGERAERLSARLRGAWAAFAREGEPAAPGLPRWPRYAPPRRATLELGDEPRVLEAPGEAERALWASLDWKHA